MTAIRCLPPSLLLLLLAIAATATSQQPVPAPLPIDQKPAAGPPAGKPADGRDAAAAITLGPWAFPADARIPEAAPSPPLGADPIDAVVWDDVGGRLWALGRTYKAAFDAAGMTFVPCFGAAAPRNFPIRFRLESVHVGDEPLALGADRAPRRDGDVVSVDHGCCREVFALDLHAVEQSFVFAAMPATGDLVVRLRAETELVRVAARDGLAFRNDHGTVDYRKAVVFDAAGQRQAIGIEPAGERDIVLRVPQAFLARAKGPITIDPIVAVSSAVSVATSLDFHADVAFGGGSGVAVWQRVFSGNDHDVFVRWFVSGAVLAVDFTSANWVSPRIATDAASGTALVVAQVGQPWLQRVVMGRVVNPMAVATGPFPISGPEAGSATNPDVGGDPSGTPGSRYCVVWEREFSATDHDILFQTVNPNGTLGAPFSGGLDTATTFESHPRIATTCGPVVAGSPQFWPVVWQRTFSASDEDIRGTTIAANGAASPSFGIDAATADDQNPVVSSPTLPFSGSRAFLVAYERAMPTGNHDVVGRAFLGAAPLGSPVNLSASMDPAAAAALDQVHPSVDCDGGRFCVAFCERNAFAPTGDNNLFAATWTLTNGLALHEPPRAFGNDVFGAAEIAPSVVNVFGSTLFSLVFERVNAATSDRDVRGAVFDASLGRVPFVAGGCIAPPISYLSVPITTPHVPGMSVTLSVFASLNTSPPWTALGPALPAPAWACTACTLMVDLPAATWFTGTLVSFTIPADPRLVGTTIAVQSMQDFYWGVGFPVNFLGCIEYPLTYSRALVIPIN